MSSLDLQEINHLAADVGQEDPNPNKDDNTYMAMGTFAFLMALTLGVIAFWAYNVYLLNQSGRLKRNNMHLILFQFNSLLTLICKDDPQMKLSHPPYSPLYILHGLCFMVWCLQIQHIHVASLLRLRLHGIQLHDELVRHLIM